MKKSLDARVSDVIASSRLVDSAACLVLSKDEPGAQLKRILEASGQTFDESKPVFEVNLKHKLIKKLGIETKMIVIYRVNSSDKIVSLRAFWDYQNMEDQLKALF